MLADIKQPREKIGNHGDQIEEKATESVSALKSDFKTLKPGGRNRVSSRITKKKKKANLVTGRDADMHAGQSCCLQSICEVCMKPYIIFLFLVLFAFYCSYCSF